MHLRYCKKAELSRIGICRIENKFLKKNNNTQITLNDKLDFFWCHSNTGKKKKIKVIIKRITLLLEKNTLTLSEYPFSRRNSGNRV